MRTWPENHPKARLLERKQEAIKGAAKELFLQHGYANTTMEMVASRAGVSIMTLYRHFRSKDVLFESLIPYLCMQHVRHDPETFWQGSPAEVLHKLGQVRMGFVLNPEEVALYRVIIGALEHFPEIGRMYYHLHFEIVLEKLSVYLKKLDQENVLRIPNPQRSAEQFLGLFQGLMSERVRLNTNVTLTQEEVDQHIETCVSFFLAAHQN